MATQKHKIPNLFEKLKFKVFLRFKSILGIPIRNEFKNFNISLPANHSLIYNQYSCPNYDRFLPHLVTYFKSNETVIDIGANVGDTLAAMVDKNSLLNYICIEADETFFEFLNNNIKKIKAVYKDLRVSTIKTLIGKNITGVKLEGGKGSKHAVQSKNGAIVSQSLDDLITEFNIDNLRLLKSDVDGFDYDVLESSLHSINICKPILYFECQFDHEYQKNGFEQIFSKLENIGYKDWVVFDNFGEIILRTQSTDILNYLISYVWSQNTNSSNRTIYYYDILATQSTESNLITQVLIDYQ